VSLDYSDGKTVCTVVRYSLLSNIGSRSSLNLDGKKSTFTQIFETIFKRNLIIHW